MNTSTTIRVTTDENQDHLVVRVGSGKPFDCYPGDLIRELMHLRLIVEWRDPSVDEVIRRGGEVAFQASPMPRLGAEPSTVTDVLLLDAGGGGYHVWMPARYTASAASSSSDERLAAHLQLLEMDDTHYVPYPAIVRRMPPIAWLPDPLSKGCLIVLQDEAAARNSYASRAEEAAKRVSLPRTWISDGARLFRALCETRFSPPEAVWDAMHREEDD